MSASADEIRELIVQVLAEQQRERSPRRRAPVSRYADETGKTWYSATLNRLQALAVLAGLLGSISGVVWATMGARDRLEVFPVVNERIITQAQATETRIAAEYATKRELERAIAAINERGAAELGDVRVLQEQVATLRAQVTRVEEKLDRIERELVGRK